MCRAVWERGEQTATLSAWGVSYELHTRLYRCDACGSYWEELERYAHQIPDAEALEVQSHSSFERSVGDEPVQGSPEANSLNELAMRLRRTTSRSPLMCVELLRPLSALERLRYVEHYESSGLSLFIDPIELDPEFMHVMAAVRKRAASLRDQGQFGRGMGGGGSMHVWMKSELAKHGIRWRTPREMNPGVAFD
jgi:hypothetical protein